MAVGHAALVVGRVALAGLRHRRPAVARQVGDHERQKCSASAGATACHITLVSRVAVQQQQRRPLAAGAREHFAGRGVDPVRASRDRDREIGSIRLYAPRPRSAALLPLHRLPADVAAAEAVRPADAVDRRDRRAPAPRVTVLPSAETLSTRPPLARILPPSALVPAWKISTPSTSRRRVEPLDHRAALRSCRDSPWPPSPRSAPRPDTSAGRSS